MDDSGAPWHIDSIRCGSSDLTKEELVVGAGQQEPIEVVLRDDSATLTVKIPSADSNASSTVVMLPQAAPSQLRVISIYGNTEAGVPGLAPGDYKVFAFDSNDPIEYTNPDVLARYASQATRVSLAPHANTTITLNLIHAEPQ